MLTRHSLVKAGLAGVAACPSLLASAATAATPGSRRPFRIAHLTDIHVQPELECANRL